MSRGRAACAEIAEGGREQLDDVMLIMAEAFDPRFGEAWTRAQCDGIFAYPGALLSLARIDEGPAGFALSRQIIDEIELLLLAVRPAVRRSGVGAALLARIVAAAQDCGVRRLFLEMRDGNEAARLYRDAGFEEAGRRHDYYRGSNGQRFDALTLALNLTGDSRA